MTSITLSFDGYPALICSKPRLYSGYADIEAGETLRLPTCLPGALTIPERPLQRPMRWSFTSVALIGATVADEDDLRRWITGRHWHRIPTLIYAQFLSERGLEKRAETYRRLAA